MTRVKAILFSVFATWIFVVVADCSSDIPDRQAAIRPVESLLPSGPGQQHAPVAANPLTLAAHHSARRVHFQPRADGADSLPGPAHLPAVPCETQFDSSVFSRLDPALTQRWQFLWRTAAEPRAPSLVS
jgi:hypothetical protein